ncbi:methyltransferase domain-containing protein [Nocardioides sp. B-3]|uniref:methyltransferase domain-containing protein n=1 Tax=Nocardioides sp. B-3 TaxID=2895565 RepID=UPI0021527601|nr:methyltransferase domain-containing protein [Nocardioides sp. B-3]UUZ61029.1 methyltransferase domain-containing protein [Nocardioides sp. B-3]
MTTGDLKALTPTSFRRGNLPADAAADPAARVMVLDMQELMPGIQRLRDWTLAALAPQPGETAVDLGCGTGAEVRRLAALVGPAGRAVGIEPHAGLRTQAEARALAEGSTAVFVEGDAPALPFEDGTVDVIRSERVFQHLDDPAAAAREIARVLAPGGRVALVDSDWGSMVQSMGEPDVVRRLMDASFRRWTNPFAGRSLRWLLRRAGLVVDAEVGADAAVLPEEQLRVPVLLRNSIEHALADGAITVEEGDRLERDNIAGAERGEAFVAVMMFSVIGRSVDPAG